MGEQHASVWLHITVPNNGDVPNSWCCQEESLAVQQCSIVGFTRPVQRMHQSAAPLTCQDAEGHV